MRAPIRLGLALGFVAVAVSAAAALGAPGNGKRSGEGRERKGGPGHALMKGRIVHGEWVVKAKDGSFDTHRVNNGDITAIDGSKITIKRADGESLTFTIPADARVRRGRDADGVSALKVGDRAHVLEVNTGDGFVVKAVRARPPKSGAAKERKDRAPGASFEDAPLEDGALLGV